MKIFASEAEVFFIYENNWFERSDNIEFDRFKSYHIR